MRRCPDCGTGLVPDRREGAADLVVWCPKCQAETGGRDARDERKAEEQAAIADTEDKGQLDRFNRLGNATLADGWSLLCACGWRLSFFHFAAQPFVGIVMDDVTKRPVETRRCHKCGATLRHETTEVRARYLEETLGWQGVRT